MTALLRVREKGSSKKGPGQQGGQNRDLDSACKYRRTEASWDFGTLHRMIIDALNKERI